LAPPLTRLLAPRSFLLCSLLEDLFILNTHYLGVIRKAPWRGFTRRNKVRCSELPPLKFDTIGAGVRPAVGIVCQGF